MNVLYKQLNNLNDNNKPYYFYSGENFFTFLNIFLFIVLFLFIVTVENNVVRTGKELDRFYKNLNPEWLDENKIKSNDVQYMNKKAIDYKDKEPVEDKIKFLILTHSILMQNKKHEKRFLLLSQVVKDRPLILDHLKKEFEDNKVTQFNCYLATCKDKEYKVTNEKLQTIKKFNMQLNGYYTDLNNLNTVNNKDSKNKPTAKVTTVKDDKLRKSNFKVVSALNEKEKKWYSEMK